MMDALIAGERDLMILAVLAQRRMRSKIPELQPALVGRVGDHHAAMLRLHLAHIDQLDLLIDNLDAQIEAKLVPIVDDAARVATITGVGPITAQVLIAEIGVGKSVLPTADHLASWCGGAKGTISRPGKRDRDERTWPGASLTDTLIQASWAAARPKDMWFSARFWRLSRRIGKKKAIVVTAHAIVIAILRIHTNRWDYQDLRVHWWDKRSSLRNETERLKRRLEALGHHVTLEPAVA